MTETSKKHEILKGGGGGGGDEDDDTKGDNNSSQQLPLSKRAKKRVWLHFSGNRKAPRVGDEYQATSLPTPGCATTMNDTDTTDHGDDDDKGASAE